MKRLMRRIHLDDKGFTMMELLIVVALIGVLVAVVVPNVARFIGRGEEEAARAELKSIQTAIDAVIVDLGLPLGQLEPQVNVTSFDVDIDPDAGVVLNLYPEFLRTKMASAQLRDGTLASYGWDSDGKVESTAIDPATGNWR